MSRPLRIQFPGCGVPRYEPWRGQDNQHLSMTKTIKLFSILWPMGHRLWQIEMFAYVLMGNHYHLCLRTPKGNLSRVMRHVDGLYTQRFNRRHGRDGTLFRGRYRAILVDADEYLSSPGALHSSESRRGQHWQSMPEDYRWGSHRYYLQAKGSPGWLDTAEASGANWRETGVS